MYANNTLTIDIHLLKVLSKEDLEKKFSDAYADFIWLQAEGRHKNDPHYNHLAIKVMDIMEHIQRAISKKSGYKY